MKRRRRRFGARIGMVNSMADNYVQDSLAAALQDAGVHDVVNGVRAIQNAAGNGVTDDDVDRLLPLLLRALEASPDPDRALQSFVRWLAAVSAPYSHVQNLLGHPVALDVFCLITGSSQYFGDLIVRHPEYFEVVANPGVRGETKTGAEFGAEAAALVGACQRTELKKDALRRWKAREMLRIGVRDLTGLADMPSTALEFSHLADACVQQALNIAVDSIPRVASLPGAEAVQWLSPQERSEAPGLPPIAVIGMGKLGGQELNYSSDIDLMFVLSDDLPAEVRNEKGQLIETVAWLSRVAETLIKSLNEETSEGHVFRVDMRLRPEGRFGVLVRSLSSYRAYYENWAEGWERQALLKARPLAGDPVLGAAFMEMVTPFVYRPAVSAEFLESIRANKRKIEQRCAIEGETETNVKTGFGGIRDIEFLVQLFQLEMGGRSPALRTPNTLAGLQRLREAHILTQQEALELSDDYGFLRTLEHRLQLLHKHQTQALPPEHSVHRRFLALRMGFPDEGAFEADLRARRARVNRRLERLFYQGDEAVPAEVGPPVSDWSDVAGLLDTLESPASVQALSDRLSRAGFRDVPTAIAALRLPMSGNEFGGMPPDTPDEFKAVAPRLLQQIAASAHPDNALAGLEALALAVPNRAQLYASMDESPDVIERLVGLGAASPPLMQRLTQHQEWLETVLGEEPDGPEDVRANDAADFRSLPSELVYAIGSVASHDKRLEVIARYYLRETLRIGARDIWGWDTVPETMARLTRVAEEVLSGLMNACADVIVAAAPDSGFARDSLDRVAAVGLGKLGGAELGYASDWDIVFVYDEGVKLSERHGQERSALATRLVEGVTAAARSLASFGAGVEIDLRLRPWGKKGALALTPHAYLDYLTSVGETWERQSALKARFAAGSRAVGRRMERIFSAVSVGRAASAADLAAVTAMKRRIETERLRAAERETNLKLGLGGLSDIEWLAQKLQMEHGASMPAVRAQGTLEALRDLAAAGILASDESAELAETYQLLTRLRNGLWLLNGHTSDLISDPGQRRTLARRLGRTDTAFDSAEMQLWNTVRARMSAARRIFDRRFYSA